MHVNLRRYRRIGASRTDIEASVWAEFLPELARQRGFRRYCAFWTEDGEAVSISVFDDELAAQQSTDLARRWIMRHRNFFPERGEEFSGEYIGHTAARGGEEPSDNDRDSSYVVASEWQGVPTTERLHAVAAKAADLLAGSKGLRSAYMAEGSTGDCRALVVIESDGQQNALECHRRLAQILGADMPGAKAARVMQGRIAIAAASG